MGLREKLSRTIATLLLPVLVSIRRIISRSIRHLSGRADTSSRVFAELNPSDIALRKADHMDKIQYSVPGSFVELMNYRTKKKSLSDTKLPEWALNDKMHGSKLADLSEIRVPKIYQNRVTLADIEWRGLAVVKPAPGAGSRGVFCYYDKDKIWDVYNAKYLSSHKELIDALKKHNAFSGRDSWMIEELILAQDGERPRDIKFYCFYGEVGMVLELSGGAEKKYCFWSADGQALDTAIYSKKKLFSGSGFSTESLDAAKHLSQEVPAPFIRIDFLEIGEEPFFGEFTPRPGGLAFMNKETDKLLGGKYIEAETRLFNDLVEGKNFEKFKQAISK